MPAYNAAAFIGGAIRSVLRQVHENWELFVVDDGSSDETPAVAATFSDPRIRLVRLAHGGVSAARNAGLEAMTGDAIAFLDADDELTSTSLSSRLPILEARREVEFVDGNVVFMDAGFESERGRYSPSFRGRPLAKLVELSPECFAGPYWLVRRRPGKSYRLKEAMTHCEDLLFYIAIASDGEGEYDYTDEVVARVRRDAISAMSDLEGLERGYRTLCDEVATCGYADPPALRRLRRRVRRIVWRSYAKKGRWLLAWRSLFASVRA